MTSNRKFATQFSLGVAMCALIPGIAVAQTEQTGQIPAEQAAVEQAAEEGESASDIVVTGTLIRGIAPGGSQSLAVTQEEMKVIGAANTSQILAAVPQTGLFLNAPVASSRLSVNRPILRNLGNSSSGSSSTLVLLDGHRMPGMGVRQVSPDVDAIAPGAIERVEIVTDGGSSLYGSDAVGGVLNFITRRKFDGLEARGHYGFGDGYRTWDASVTAGTSWDWGSAYVSYSYAWSKTEGARDYVRNIDWVFGDLAQTTCDPGNIVQTVGTAPNAVTTVYALPNLVAGRGNRCDFSDITMSQQGRHSVFGGVTLDNGSAVSVSVKAYYFNRTVNSFGAPVTASITVGPTITAAGVTAVGGNPATVGLPNPAYTPVSASTASETYQLSLQRVLGPTSPPGVINTEAWGVTVAPKWRISDDWQLNAFMSVAEGKADYSSRFLNSTLLGQYANAGLFLPNNLSAPSNTAALNAAIDWFDMGRAKDRIMNVRAVFDGPLFSLPGGQVRVAFGGEVMVEDYEALIRLGINSATLAATPNGQLSRTIKSVFGEANIPIIGPEMETFLHAVTLSLSGRYDHYSDLGGTFNPKIGINIEPNDWIKLRGNWGKSYQAPSLADGKLLNPNSFSNLGSARFLYGPAALPGQTEVFLGGVVDPLKPQTATTYSFGFDVRPMDKLSFGATYYRVKFKDQIAVTPVFLGNATQLFPSLVMVNPINLTNPSQEYITAYNNLYNQLVAQAVNPTVLTSVAPNLIYAIADGRQRNLSSVDVQGLDFNANLTLPTAFGDVYFNAAGNVILKFVTEQFAGAAKINTTNNDSHFRLSATVGTHIGNFMGQVRYSHQSGFNVTPSAANLQQATVGSFNVFDLFAEYRFKDPGFTKDLALSLNIDNVFNQAPPLYRGNLGVNPSGPGYANGFTLGRVIKFGLEKRF